LLSRSLRSGRRAGRFGARRRVTSPASWSLRPSSSSAASFARSCSRRSAWSTRA
jgi:hypothetical protein